MSTTATRQEPAAKGPAGRGVWESQHDEHDYVISQVEGKLPQGLRGTLYRNGSGKFESGGQPLGHLWDGDGLLSMFVLDGERVLSQPLRTHEPLPGRARGQRRAGATTGHQPAGRLAGQRSAPAGERGE